MGFCATNVIYSIIILTHAFAISEVSAVCDVGKFGRDCLLECHCAVGDSCGADGICTDCAPGWAGPTCQIVLENVAINKNATQEPTTREDNYASYAVDGDLGTFSWVIDKDEPLSVSLTVDLGEEYEVDAVKVVFEATGDKKVAGYRVFMSANKDDPAKVCYSHKTQDAIPPVSRYLRSCNGTTRYVTVGNSRALFPPDEWSKYPNLVIAEVEVMAQTDCSSGTFGPSCDQECGHCVDKSCNKDSGVCQGDCKPGYFGDNCMQECATTCKAGCDQSTGDCIGDCDEKFYGKNCDMKCSNCMKSCDIGGVCTSEGCIDGYYGDRCDLECGHCVDSTCARDSGACPGDCEPNFFGDKCMQKCADTCGGTCLKDNGHCIDKCAAKHYGDFCDKKCPIGCKECMKTGDCTSCTLITSYGRYCNITCPNCKGGCEQNNGACIGGCKDKFYGEKCDMKCSNCMKSCSIGGACTLEGCIDGHYGDKCDQKCASRCVTGENCDRTTGHCGKCEANHYGDFCQHNCSSNCKDETCFRNGSCINSCTNNKFHGEKCDLLCSKDIPFCVECEDVQGIPQCLKCDSNRYGDQCLGLCPDNCESCINSTDCMECKTGYTGNICQYPCEIEHCNKCSMDNIDICVECEDGWYGTLCDKRCSDQCKSCITEPECSACDRGKFLIAGQCVACLSNCVTCESMFNCSACIAGKYGNKCDESCPSDCLECTSEDVCTKCQEGRDGSKCLCSHNCKRAGDITKWCDVSTGQCLVGCVDGKFGTNCDTDCSDGCSVCAQSGGKCDVCDSGYYGISCDKNCGHCMPEGGKIECDKNSGECLGKCTDGYFGVYCNKSCGVKCDPSFCEKSTGNCKSCSPGFYKDKCEEPCPVNCDNSNGQDVCDKQSGDCRACKDGFFGIKCNETCSPTCESSLGKNGCDKSTGKCFKCKQRFYGDFCDKRCKSYCASDCKQADGGCDACKDNFYMKYCTARCPENCGPDPEGSSKSITCNRWNGECVFCQPGFYGEHCEDECPSNCFKHCHKATGMCNHCMTGYHGNYCESQCSRHCSHTQQYTRGSCNQTSGHCNEGCKDGYENPMCLKALPPGDEPLPIIIGVVAATVLVVIILVIIAVVCYKRRKAATRDQINAHKKNGAHKRELNGQTTEEINPLIQNNVSSYPPGSGNGATIVNETAVDGADYYNQNTRIPVSGFTEYLQERKKENLEWFKEEFSKLPKGLIKPCITATSFGNRGRCRYKQLYPYDHNRVKLEPDGEDTHDFINASYVNGYNQPQAFIAAQGPTESTVNDFWRMIFQKDCGKVVMLTNLFEELKKCERYWPDVHETLTYGKYEVTNVFETELPSYTVRHLRAVHSVSEEEKEFLHIHYTAWPDRGVPDNPSVMLNFRDKVMEEHTSLDGPILVHCSAGIGRTGTFVALDYLLRQAKEETHIDVFNTVKQMRNERTNFVQTDIQYEFVHNAIYEALNVKEFELSEDKFIQQYHSMKNVIPGHTKTILEEQFELIHEMSPKLDESHFKAGCADENSEKNRHPDILPIDMYRAYLSTPVKGSNEYINAIFLPTCTNKTGFLITQTPMPNTVTDFWRLVYDQHVSNIVMMNSIICEDESVEEYWSSSTSDSTYGPFRVKFDGTQEDYEGYSVMRIQLTYTKWGEPTTMNVKLFRFEGWQDGDNLPFSPALTSLISQVSASSKDSKTEPIIVHCMDGAERSGLFCAISAILERLKLEKKVNIPQIIMQLRARRPQIVNTMDQFNFCYQAVAEYLESNQIYTNIL